MIPDISRTVIAKYNQVRTLWAKEKLTQKIATVFFATITFAAMSMIAPKLLTWTFIAGFFCHEPVNHMLEHTVNQIKGVWNYSKPLFVVCSVVLSVVAFPHIVWLATVASALHHSAKAGAFIYQYSHHAAV